MEPKFQSSFIPKGSIASAPGIAVSGRARRRDLISLLAVSIFTISVLLAGGVFLYKLYLNYGIAKMGESLESSRAALAPETVDELIKLNNRIVSTNTLIDKHRIISPIFDFLESSTPRTVRFTEFAYTSTDKGLELTLKGEARGYAALALASEIITKSNYFKNPLFSDLNLDDEGNVVFSLRTNIDPSLVSYSKSLEGIPQGTLPVTTGTTTPLTATSTPKQATTTKTTN